MEMSSEAGKRQGKGTLPPVLIPKKTSLKTVQGYLWGGIHISVKTWEQTA